MRTLAGLFLSALFGVSLCSCGSELAPEPADSGEQPGQPRASLAAEDPSPSPGGCAGMTVPEENHASIRLAVDQPASGAQLSVDEQGKIAINGVLHKQA